MAFSALSQLLRCLMPETFALQTTYVDLYNVNCSEFRLYDSVFMSAAATLTVDRVHCKIGL